MKKNKLHHMEYKKLLSTYQDNELDAATHEQIRLHLAACPSCRDYLANLDQLTGNLRTLAPVAPNPFFTPQIMTKINQSYQTKNRWYVRFALPSLLYSAVFLVFFGLSLWGIGLLQAPSLLPNTTTTQPQVQEIDFAQVLSQSQQLSLLQVQDHSFDLLTPNNQTTTTGK